MHSDPLLINLPPCAQRLPFTVLSDLNPCVPGGCRLPFDSSEINKLSILQGNLWLQPVRPIVTNISLTGYCQIEIPFFKRKIDLHQLYLPATFYQRTLVNPLTLYFFFEPDFEAFFFGSASFLNPASRPSFTLAGGIFFQSPTFGSFRRFCFFP